MLFKYLITLNSSSNKNFNQERIVILSKIKVAAKFWMKNPQYFTTIPLKSKWKHKLHAEVLKWIQEFCLILGIHCSLSCLPLQAAVTLTVLLSRGVHTVQKVPPVQPGCRLGVVGGQSQHCRTVSEGLLWVQK